MKLQKQIININDKSQEVLWIVLWIVLFYLFGDRSLGGVRRPGDERRGHGTERRGGGSENEGTCGGNKGERTCVGRVDKGVTA